LLYDYEYFILFKKNAYKYFPYLKEHHEKCVTGEMDRLKRKSLDLILSNECNLAFNRQTRMLALFDANFTLCEYLEKRNSLNSEFYDTELLRRAKLGLHSLAFYGLAEEQILSRRLFSSVFKNNLEIKGSGMFMKMKKSAVQFGPSLPPSTEIIGTLNSSTLQKIANANKLDIELYEYAAKLFQDRLDFFKIKS
jgi:hypothetical protein